jgi:inosine-uridine nucleoside N-ribohydrolase
MAQSSAPETPANEVKAAAQPPVNTDSLQKGAPVQNAKPKPQFMDYLDSAEAVDHAVDVTFIPRKPPMDIEPIRAAWKAIVADADRPLEPIVADTSRPPVKIIYDTDIGTDVDDAIALAFALRRPELQVLGVTTSRKEVYQRAAIVSRLLQVMDRTDVPYAPGSPTLADGTVSRETKPVNQFPFAGPENDRPKPAFDDAQDLFREIITANPGEVWLVLVGPFTNAAILIRDHPELAAQLKGIVCMGGDLSRAQNETNIDNDRSAAPIVFSSGLMKFAGTDNVTIRILVTKQDMEHFRATDTPTTRALHELITKYWKTTNAYSKPGPVGFDVCPVAWLIAPEMFTTIETGIRVQGGKTFPSEDQPPCAATTDVDAVAVHRLLMDTLTAK